MQTACFTRASAARGSVQACTLHLLTCATAVGSWMGGAGWQRTVVAKQLTCFATMAAQAWGPAWRRRKQQMPRVTRSSGTQTLHSWATPVPPSLPKYLALTHSLNFSQARTKPPSVSLSAISTSPSTSLTRMPMSISEPGLNLQEGAACWSAAKAGWWNSLPPLALAWLQVAATHSHGPTPLPSSLPASTLTWVPP